MQGYYYDKIAIDYDLKRRKPWKALENFLSSLKDKGYSFNGIILDLGCANGRNFILFKNSINKIIGIDNSIEFLKIALKNLRDPSQYNIEASQNIYLILGDLKNLPLRANTIRNTFSIAAIHHVKSKSARKKMMKQIAELMKEDSFLVLTSWRRWQKKYKKQFFIDKIKRTLNPKYNVRQNKMGLHEFGDKIIPWTISSLNITENRFYHFFSKKEIKKLMSLFQIEEFSISGGPTDKDNFFILARNTRV